MADRLLTINIRKYLVTQPRTKRARKAVKFIRERVSHYTKIKQENIRIGDNLNELIFKKYSRTMVPVKVRVKMGTDTADVLPFSEQVKESKMEKKETEKKAEKKSIVSIQKSEAQKPREQPKPKEAAKPKEQEKK